MKITYDRDNLVMTIREDVDLYNSVIIIFYVLLFFGGIFIIPDIPERTALQLLLGFMAILVGGLGLIGASKGGIVVADKKNGTFVFKQRNLLKTLDATWSYPLDTIEKLSVDYEPGYRSPSTIWFNFCFAGKVPTAVRAGRPHRLERKFVTKIPHLRNLEQEVVGPEVAKFLNTQLEITYRSKVIAGSKNAKYFE